MLTVLAGDTGDEVRPSEVSHEAEVSHGVQGSINKAM